MLIAIEGIDGSGKNTQSILLKDYLEECGYRVKLMSFPFYKETFFGEEIERYLKGFYGNLGDIPSKLSSILFALDRFEKKSEINDYIKGGYIVIADRYVYSNVAFQGVNYKGNLEDFLKWIENLEFNVLGMKIPDIVIYLKISSGVSNRLLKERENSSSELDIHERNMDYLNKVSVNYDYISRIRENWKTVFCEKEGELRNKNEIFEDIKSLI